MGYLIRYKHGQGSYKLAEGPPIVLFSESIENPTDVAMDMESFSG